MSAPLLTIHVGSKPYDEEGDSIAVRVEFNAKDGAAQVTSVAFKNWSVVARWPTTQGEAAYALERLMRVPTDQTWVHGWNKLSPGEQWKAIAILRAASSDCLLSPG